jgi:hypothetical protein
LVAHRVPMKEGAAFGAFPEIVELIELVALERRSGCPEVLFPTCGRRCYIRNRVARRADLDREPGGLRFSRMRRIAVRAACPSSSVMLRPPL